MPTGRMSVGSLVMFPICARNAVLSESLDAIGTLPMRAGNPCTSL